MDQPNIHPEDGGPIYYESDFDALIAEPTNMASAAIFIPIALFWMLKNEKRKKPSRFMRFASVLLLIGGVGGTIYHGFRISALAMYMDWLPILILCIAASAYFLQRVYSSTKIVLAGSVLLLILMMINAMLVPIKHSTNFGYALMATYVLIPTFLILYKTRWKNAIYIVLAFASFSVALFFRIYDRDGLLDVGTHFLWHVFGAISTYFMFFYVFRLSRLKVVSAPE